MFAKKKARTTITTITKFRFDTGFVGVNAPADPFFIGPMNNDASITQAALRALLKEHGMRVTAQRLAVLLVLNEQRGPLSHEEVMKRLDSGLYDKASIWRVLSDVSNIGIVRRMDLGDRVWRYEMVDDCHTVEDRHPHFLCESCGEVTCLPPLEVRTKDGRVPEKLLATEFHIRISGHCGDCKVA